ncbi:hypothetical protein ACFV4K_01350 [Nocardia sp. NPDC059764]|uniref:hypothetical protein n=1 Tax=Nocardia sp. NPDC059764 TaxID=3346939 RepID=UPI003658F958
MEKGPVIGFSEYRPHGESLTFTRGFPADVESSEVLFADALRVRDHLANVVRPTGFDLWFTCAIEDTYINVDDPQPSDQYWEVLRADATAPQGDDPQPAVVTRFPVLTDADLIGTYRQALDTITCPPGYFVMFESIAPLGATTRFVRTDESPSSDVLSVTLWDDTLNLPVTTEADGTTWLGPLPDAAPYLPPVTFRIWFDSILVLTLDVNWGRWLEAGSAEHALLQAALDALLADDWQLTSGEPRHFEL